MLSPDLFACSQMRLEQSGKPGKAEKVCRPKRPKGYTSKNGRNRKRSTCQKSRAAELTAMVAANFSCLNHTVALC